MPRKIALASALLQLLSAAGVDAIAQPVEPSEISADGLFGVTVGGTGGAGAEQHRDQRQTCAGDPVDTKLPV